MAVLPQSIVFKTSQDDPALIIAAASAGGDQELLRGEIVMGIESGRVQLYAQDINGNAVSLVPPVPGYDISGNSIFDLGDVAPDGQTQQDDVLKWSNADNAFIPQGIDWSEIANRPTNLNQFENTNYQFVERSTANLNSFTLQNVNKSGVMDDDDMTDGVYLQYSRSLDSWEYVTSISADITGNSIFDFYNVSNPNGSDNPPPNNLNYLRWNGSVYVPDRPYLEEDPNPVLGGDLNIDNTRAIKCENNSPRNFRFKLGNEPLLTLERWTAYKKFEGDATELGDVTAGNKTGIDFEIPGYDGISAGTSPVYVSQRPPGMVGLRSPEELEFYDFIDNNNNPRREYKNYDIVLPQGPPLTSGVIAVWNVSQEDLDRDTFGTPADRPTPSNRITTTLAYKKYDLPSLDDVQIDASSLSLNSVLAYQPNIDKWINVPASGPGDITGNSIGDLRDVTLTVDTFDPVDNTQLTVGGEITIDTVNRYYIDGDDVDPANTSYMGIDEDLFRGITLAHYRKSDGLGSYIHADRDRGVELNSYASMTRLSGDRTRTDNRPELRFESSHPDIPVDDGDGNLIPQPYIGIKYPDYSALPAGEFAQSITYNLPLDPPTAEDQVLTCGPAGQWAWSTLSLDSIVVALGDLSNVDDVTFPPADGRVLTYQGSTGYWVPLDLPEITSTLAELTDVDLVTPPTDGQYLKYNSAFSVWQAGDVPEDWIKETPIYFQTRHSSAVNSQPSVGFWTVDQPTLLSTTLLRINKASDAGMQVGYSWSEIITNGVVILFSQQDSPGTFVNFLVNGTPVDQGSFFEIPVEVTQTLGTISGNALFICSILAGSGGGGGGGSMTLEGLDDVDINALALNDDEVLQYDKPTATWTARTPFARTLDDLTDVDIVSVAPEIGEALTWDGASWVPGEGGGGVQNGEAVERLDVNAVAADLAAGTDAQIDLLSIGQSGQFVSLTSTEPAWVRFYSTASARAADATRPIDEDPDPGSGVLLEILTTSSGQTVTASPGTTYFNNDETVDDRIYVAIRNMHETDNKDISITCRVFAAVTAKVNKGRETFVSSGLAVAPGATSFQNLIGCGKMGSFISVTANSDCWMRFYSTKAARTADQGRTQLESPLPASGVLMEIVAQAGTVYQITPQVGYFNGETEPTDDIYMAVDNLSAVFQPMVISVEAVPLEGQILAAITGAITVIDGGSFGSG